MCRYMPSVDSLVARARENPHTDVEQVREKLLALPEHVLLAMYFAAELGAPNMQFDSICQESGMTIVAAA